MSFWSSEKIRLENSGANPLIENFDTDRVERGAYELSMGSQAAISCEGPNKIVKLERRDAFCIPKGQFAVLLTEERVLVPSSVLAFISLKLSVKSRGLINVSGFHVDPGFKRRLKFWVYNAGNEDIHLLRGDAVFLIWFADLDRETKDLYEDKPTNDEITGDDLRRLHGTLASPAALAKQVEQLENKIKAFEWIGGTALVILVGLCIALATPLLDYIVKPVVERFSKGNSPIVSTQPIVPPTASLKVDQNAQTVSQTVVSTTSNAAGEPVKDASAKSNAPISDTSKDTKTDAIPILSGGNKPAATDSSVTPGIQATNKAKSDEGQSIPQPKPKSD